MLLSAGSPLFGNWCDCTSLLSLKRVELNVLRRLLGLDAKKAVSYVILFLHDSKRRKASFPLLLLTQPDLLATCSAGGSGSTDFTSACSVAVVCCFSLENQDSMRLQSTELSFESFKSFKACKAIVLLGRRVEGNKMLLLFLFSAYCIEATSCHIVLDASLHRRGTTPDSFPVCFASLPQRIRFFGERNIVVQNKSSNARNLKALRVVPQMSHPRCLARGIQRDHTFRPRPNLCPSPSPLWGEEGLD